MSRLGTHQQQVGDVGAGNHQQQADGGKQDEDRLAHVADGRVVEAPHDGRESPGHVAAPFPFELPRQARQLAGQLLRRDARSKAGDQVDLAPRRIAKGAVGRHRTRWSPHLDAPRVVDARRHDADDRERLLVHVQPSADNVAARAVAPPPQPVADHDDRFSAGDIVARSELAADRRARAEDLEEAAGDGRAVDIARLAILEKDPAKDPGACHARGALEQSAGARDFLDLGFAEGIVIEP